MNLNSLTEDLFWGLETRQRGSIPDHHLAGLISPSLKGEVKAASGGSQGSKRVKLVSGSADCPRGSVLQDVHSGSVTLKDDIAVPYLFLGALRSDQPWLGK